MLDDFFFFLVCSRNNNSRTQTLNLVWLQKSQTAGREDRLFLGNLARSSMSRPSKLLPGAGSSWVGARGAAANAAILSCSSGNARVAAATESGDNLLHRVAEMVVNGGDAGEVEFCGRTCAGKDLESHSQQTTWVDNIAGRGGGGSAVFLTMIWRWWGEVIGCWAGRFHRVQRDNDKAERKEGNAGRVLSTHCQLDAVHVHGCVHHKAARLVGAALL